MSFGEIAPKSNGGFKTVIENSNTSMVVGATSGLNAIASGAGAQAFGDNCIAIGTKARAITGSGGNQYAAIAIGQGATAGDTNFGGIAIGQAATTVGWGTAIGNSASCSAAFSLTVGMNCNGPGVQLGYGVANSGTGAIGIGNTASCSGANGINIGNNSILNNQIASTIIGVFCKTDFPGEFSTASGCFAVGGDVKISTFPMWMTTTDATLTELKTGVGTALTVPTGVITLINDCTYMFDVDLIARNTGDDTQSAAWNIKFAIRRGTAAANTVLIGIPVTTIFGQDTGTTTWTVAVTADTTNGRPAIKVTGEAAKTLRWAANVRMTKVLG